MRKEASGFTLVEICLVAVILSSLFIVAWPVFSHIADETRLETECKKIEHTLAYARDRALAEGRCYGIRFDTASRKYGVFIEDDPVSRPGEFKPVSDMPGRGQEWSREIVVKEISKSDITFKPDGTTEDFHLSFKNSRGDICTLQLQGVTGRYKLIKTNYGG